jgi:hypothetical protein
MDLASQPEWAAEAVKCLAVLLRLAGCPALQPLRVLHWTVLYTTAFSAHAELIYCQTARTAVDRNIAPVCIVLYCAALHSLRRFLFEVHCRPPPRVSVVLRL